MCRVQSQTLTFLALDARDKPGHDGKKAGLATDVRDPRSKPGGTGKSGCDVGGHGVAERFIEVRGGAGHAAVAGVAV